MRTTRDQRGHDGRRCHRWSVLEKPGRTDVRTTSETHETRGCQVPRWVGTTRSTSVSAKEDVLEGLSVTLRVFICSAAEDKLHRDELRKQLSPAEARGIWQVRDGSMSRSPRTVVDSRDGRRFVSGRTEVVVQAPTSFSVPIGEVEATPLDTRRNGSDGASRARVIRTSARRPDSRCHE